LFGNPHRRATGLVRTLVVASSTLAILLVCFAIYQYTQLEHDAPPQATTGSGGTEATVSSQAPNTGDPDEASFRYGRSGANIGGSRNIRIKIYSPDSKQVVWELGASTLDPVPGSADEFLTTDPEIRMRTGAGNDIRVTADRGILEGAWAGGQFESERGKLEGGVVIEIDRRTDKDRKHLPKEDRNKPDPRSIIRVELEEIRFDVEYAKIIIPGRFSLSARDVEFIAADLEARFNASQNRVEFLRVGSGERLVLHRRAGELGLSMAGMESGSRPKLTLAEKLYATLEQALKRRSESQSDALEEVPQEPAESTVKDDSPPPFVPGQDEREKKTRLPVKYFAKFEDNIDTTQLRDRSAVSRLEADVLEILRDLAVQDRRRLTTSSSVEEATADTGAIGTQLDESIVLQWTGRLVVRALEPDDERLVENPGTTVKAVGSPARVSHQKTNTQATAETIIFYPDRSAVLLEAGEDQPATVRSADHGLITGARISSTRTNDTMHAVVVGPGTLVQHAGDQPSGGEADQAQEAEGVRIEFAGKLELDGRFIQETKRDITGLLSWEEERRVLDRAVLTEDVAVRQGDTLLRADKLTVQMGSRPNHNGGGLVIERVVGEGHVEMTQGTDRVRCREIDVSLSTDASGEVTPIRAVAKGDVEAAQDLRTITASESLIVDFQRVGKPPPPFDVLKAHATAIAHGVDITQVDWDARRREHESKPHSEVGVRHMHAVGGVNIAAPDQELEVSAWEVDFDLPDGREIARASVVGKDHRPASVRLGDFTVSGRQIKLDVPDQWAEVPGAGRMTFLSPKDLNGRALDEPVPVVVTWQDWMKYQGRENRSIFSGNVRAVSEQDTAFNCDQLVVEFDDVQPTAKPGQSMDWWILQNIADRIGEEKRQGSFEYPTRQRFAKEPAHIVATGNATATTRELDPQTGALQSRAYLAGPRLSVNLRQDVAKMLIEGPGNLVLEDERPAREGAGGSGIGAEGLFNLKNRSGPSKVVIEWQSSMWYDFSIDQTRFEGDVQLTYFRGTTEDLEQARDTGETASRSTYLTCDVLTIDFLQSRSRPRRADNRMGRISSDRLKQFQASGFVELQDDAEGLWLTCDRLTYEKDRRILIIEGTEREPADIVRVSSDGQPRRVVATRCTYGLKSRKLHCEDFGAHGY